MKSNITAVVILTLASFAALPLRLSSQPTDPFRPATAAASGQTAEPTTGLPRNKSISGQGTIDPATGLPSNNFSGTSAPAGMTPGGSYAVGAGGGGFGGFGGNFGVSPAGWRTGSAHAGEVSLLFFQPPSPKTCDEIAEDMQTLSWLLSRNLERAFAQDSTDYKLGIPMLLAGSGRSIESTYIEGFGMVFKLPVRFPILAPASEESPSPRTAATSEWEEARHALSAPESNFGRPAGLWQGNRFAGTEPYDPRLIQTVKQRILQTLKNASNLRHLQLDKWIVVTLIGVPNPAAGPQKPNRAGAAAEESGGGANTMENSVLLWGAGEPGGPDSGRSTIMTLRVRMSNVMAYAADKLSDEQFAREAEVASYPGALSSFGRSNSPVYQGATQPRRP